MKEPTYKYADIVSKSSFYERSAYLKNIIDAAQDAINFVWCDINGRCLKLGILKYEEKITKVVMRKDPESGSFLAARITIPVSKVTDIIKTGTENSVVYTNEAGVRDCGFLTETKVLETYVLNQNTGKYDKDTLDVSSLNKEEAIKKTNEFVVL